MQCHTIKITSVDLAIIFVIYATLKIPMMMMMNVILRLNNLVLVSMCRHLGLAQRLKTWPFLKRCF